MKKLLKIYSDHRQVIDYIIWGVLTTVVNIAVFTGLHMITSWNYTINNVIAWFVSVFFAYITNKAFVFHSHSMNLEILTREVISFFGGRLGSLVVEQFILWIGISLLGGNQILVKIIDNVFVIIINYFWSKWAVFRNISKHNMK